MMPPRSIHATHEVFTKKQLSVVELTTHYLDLAQVETQNAYLLITRERALAQAKAADALLARSGGIPKGQPLFGIPLALKDILTLEGVRTTCASKILENYIPPYTATAVEKLERAGAVTLGKLNMDEFGMGGSNENSAFGAVKHPTHPDRVPGGSSGGSATAVRAGLCLAALGTDTGGSIRLPASFCGVVGLKPTYGRISRYGLVAFGSSLDQVGPMTNSVADAAVLLSTMCGPDPMDSTTAPQAAEDFSAGLAGFSLTGLRIGVPKEYFVEGLSPDVERAVRGALSWYEAQGAKLVPISLPHTKYSIAVYYLLAVSEASTNLSRMDGVRFGVRPPPAREAGDLVTFYNEVRALFGPEVKRRILLGTFALSSGYQDAYFKRACQVRRLIRQDFEKAFEQVDLIAGPVSPTTAFKRGEKTADPLTLYLNDIFTVPVNLAGLPALSVPCGDDPTGLPIGLHLIAPAFQESRLLGAAHQFELGQKSGLENRGNTE